MLSNSADLDRVDELRAAADVILVGARTVRRDNPRLLVRSADRRAERVASGLAPTPAKATVTATGDLDPQAAFFSVGDTAKLVYCPRGEERRIRRRLGGPATVVPLGEEVAMADLLCDLGERGAGRVLVEGGGSTLTQFLGGDLVDELHVAVAPFFVGDRRAPRFVGDGAFPWTAERRAPLMEARTIGDVVLLRYALSDRAVLGSPAAHAASSGSR